MIELFLLFSNELVLLWLLIFIFFIYLIEKIFYNKTLDNKYLFLVFFFFFFIFMNILFINISMPNKIYILDNYFIYSDFIQNIKGYITFLSAIFIIYLYSYTRLVKLPIFEYISLIIIIILSLFLMVSSNNLFFIFLFLEMINLSLYVLIGLNKYSNYGIEIAYKYFIQSSYVTLLGLFGISVIYIKTGTLFLSELQFIFVAFPLDNMIFFSYSLVFVTFFFKLGLFPLHNWVADLYQNAHLVTAAFISIVPKIAYIFVILQLYALVYNSSFFFFLIISVGFLSIIYGSLLSLYEVSFKRLLGYGSIVHMGFIMISISVFEIVSISAAFLYVIFYTLLMFISFIFLHLFVEKRGDEIVFLDNITSLGIFFNKNMLLGIIFSFTLLSLAGLPFFMGFFSKLYILLALISNGYFIFVMILLFMNILITLYYIRLIRFVLFTEDRHYKVIKIYNDIKFTRMLYELMVMFFFLNIIVLFYHNYLLLVIMNSIIGIL